MLVAIHGVERRGIARPTKPLVNVGGGRLGNTRAGLLREGSEPLLQDQKESSSCRNLQEPKRESRKCGDDDRCPVWRSASPPVAPHGGESPACNPPYETRPTLRLLVRVVHQS